MEEDALCRSCSAACCRSGVVMDLKSSEVEFLKNSGVLIEVHNSNTKIGTIKRIKDKLFNNEVKASYILTEDCKFLEYDKEVGAMVCSIYNDENRPGICSRFEAGEYGCMAIRAKNGIDNPEVFVQWITETQR